MSQLKAYAIDGELIEGELAPNLQCVIEEYPEIEMKIDSVAISGIPDNNTFSILVKSFTNNMEEIDITGKHLISALVETSDEEVMNREKVVVSLKRKIETIDKIKKAAS